MSTVTTRSRKDRALDLIRENRLPEAKAMCEEIARAENHPGAWSLLGVILGMQGNLGEAEECFRRAIALDHDDISSHYHLGMLLEQCGRHTDAIVSLRTAMQIDPDHLDTQLRLGCALAANLQHQEAACMLPPDNRPQSAKRRSPLPSG